jgi:PAS domain S-box-containing protein
MGKFNSIEDELSKTKDELKKIKEHDNFLWNILENYSRPFGVAYPDGKLGLVNKAFEELTGYSKEELKNMSWFHDLTPSEYHEMELEKLEELQSTGQPVRYEKEYIKKDGNRVPIELLVHLIRNDDGTPQFYYSFLTDITQRKLSQKEAFIVSEFLRIVNESTDTKNLINNSISFFRKQSNCEAVGIRLREEKDYPYFEARGFPEEFIILENSLCSYDEYGKAELDSTGNPIIECMCGNVICGRTDPELPFFSLKGSFWSNSTSELLASTSEQDRQNRTRNRCNGEGYESVALIPLFVGEQRLGLLQLNDHRKGMFTPGKIAMWERLANYLSIALAKFLAEETLQKSEEKYRQVFNNANDMITLNLLKEDGLPGNFIEVNNVGIERLGYTREEFLNMTPTDIVAEDEQSQIPKNVLNFSESDRIEFNIIHKAKDGRKIPVEVSNHLFELAGKTVALAISRDITARKLAEEALLLSENKYRTLFEENPDFNVLLSKEGTILDANYAATDLIGLTKKDIIGKNLADLNVISKEDLPFHLDKISSVTNEGILKPYEYEFIDKNNNIHSVLVHLKPVLKNEKLDHLLGVGIDITALKEAENEIKASLKEKNILIQEIHHRVKNNMQIISSLLSLQTQYVDDKGAVDLLKESQNRVMSMAMIHEKIYLSKDLIHINFQDYIQNLVSNLFNSYDIKKSRIKPRLEIDDINLNIETAVPCGLIISEIVSNSLKYAFPDNMEGEIYISLKTSGDKFRLIIGDNGVGLPEDFDFENIGSLGLLLVNNLTEQIDGEIKINSKNGTEYDISFKELEYKDRL